jgi:hypothetical protein
VREELAMPVPSNPDDDRREFLRKCGRFAAVTPPAMAMLLSVASTPTEAHASTIGRRGGDQGGDNNDQ